MAKIGSFVDPVVNKTWRRHQTWKQARSSLLWCGVNFILAFIMYIEMTFMTFGSQITEPRQWIWYAECGALFVFLLNMTFHLFRYLRPYISSSSVEVTEEQKRLLAISDSDRGFTVSPKKSHNSESSEGSLVFSSTTPTGQSSFTKSSPTLSGGRITPTNLGSLNYSPQSMSAFSSPGTYERSIGSPGGSASHMSHSPGSAGYNVSGFTPHVSGYSPNLSSYSPHVPGFSPNVSGYSPNIPGYSPNVSIYSQNLSGYSPNMSAYSPGMAPYTPSPNVSGFTPHTSAISPAMLGVSDSSGLRSRNTLPHTFKSPSGSSSFDRITDQHSLSAYLRDQEEKEYMKSALSSPENSVSAGTSFWSYGRTAMDYTHVLKKYVYQLASRSPHSPTTRNSDTDQSAPFAEDIWSKRGVTEDDLFLWTERLRKWICLTIVSKLRNEIDEVNAKLRRIGSEDTEIGEVGVSTLKQLALTKGPYVPTLNAVVPYLDFSSNQEYLVKRIMDLGKDGCMSEFCWNGGGDYGKSWGEHLPTDAALVVHLFCTYLDSRLPAQPKYPDGKTFTSQYFIKTPDKPNLEKDDTICLYQSSINPPHFQVVIGKNVHNIPKGRNNMFHAMLLFLHHIDKKEHGMLGRVNLGMSGVKILWIFQ